MIEKLTHVLAISEVLLPLALALVLGGLVGIERLLHTQTTGVRTHMLVSMGSACFVLAAREAFSGQDDQLARIVQGVASGIGFIGAGTILKLSQPAEIRGLTTAATVWLSSSVGVSCGLRAFHVAIWSTVLAIVVLAILRPYERSFESGLAKRRNGHAEEPNGKQTQQDATETSTPSKLGK